VSVKANLNIYTFIQHSDTIKFKKKHKQVITVVFYVIDQNVKIFRGFVQKTHRLQC